MVKSENKFKDCDDLQTYLRNGGILFDIISVNNIPMLLDYYDSSGKEVTFGNPKKKFAIELITENRYTSIPVYNDVVVNLIDDPVFRNDIDYGTIENGNL